MLLLAKIPSLNRRSVLTSMLSMAALPACTQTSSNQPMPTARTLTPDEKHWKHKFRGLGGGELFADAFGQKNGVTIFDEKGRIFFARASVNPRNNSRYGYGAEFGVPITLRATWREDKPGGQGQAEDLYRVNSGGQGYTGGILIGDVTVAVAERIPDAVLDRVRQYGGVFVLKLRLTDETLLIGWEVKNGSRYPFKKDRAGNSYEVDGDRMQGGDFCEAQIRALPLNDRNQVDTVLLKGWYIDKKTGQKIETDF
jgi:hypothetical protein